MTGIANNPCFGIIDETADYIVVDKPAPLKIHPGSPDGVETMWDGLRGLLAYELANGGQISIINRLDRETSGVVLVAKNAATARLFGMAMMHRQIHKAYLAIVRGHPEWETLDLNAPILRKGEVMESPVWVKQMVHPDGTPCTTRFRVARRWTHDELALSLIEATPHTGRMHQIRVHLAHLGHPVLGDKIYGPDETCYLDFMETGWTPELERRLLLNRHALHSHRLAVEAEEFSGAWESPLPPALAACLPHS